MFKGKISVIGAGFVGSTTAYTLMLSEVASEIVIIDINKEKAEGDALDMNHGISFVSPMTIVGSDNYEYIKDSDIIIITAGANQKKGESRIDLLKRNGEIFKSILNEVNKYAKSETVILVVTNPVDILTYMTHKISGLPKKQIIGSGTVLDTSRLKFLLGENTNIDTRNIHSYIIGEHGDSEVPTWSLTNIAGVDIENFSVISNNKLSKKIDKDYFYNKTKNSAYEIIDKKGATYYAIALSVKKIVECITGDENSILTVSSFLDGEYGIKDTCLSVPTIVNRHGVRQILEVPITDNELNLLKQSANNLKKLSRELGF